MAQTIKELLDYIEEVKPNDYSDEIKVRWLNELEGMVQTELLLLPVEGIIRYKWPEDKNAELIVKEPHDKIYEDFILWKLDQMMGEAERANNSGAIFNDAWSEYARWIAMNIDPQGGYAERNLYYLTAYQTAVKLGFVGSEEEWIESLRGEQGPEGKGLQIGGRFDTLEELIEAVPEPEKGDAYMVGEFLYIYDDADWVNCGKLRGEPGRDGVDGAPGQDGFSPTVNMTRIAGGYRITITDMDGQHSAEIMDGQDGQPGRDGEDGQQGPAGRDGADGQPGPAGSDGQDGISPTVEITDISGGHRVTITDAEGQHSFNVMDGQGGGGGTSIHGQLTGRSDADQHPMEAVTGLNAALAGKQPTINDLTSIRAGAAAGATAMQPGDLADWAKAETKPNYTAQEVGALPENTPIPDEVTEQTVAGWGFTKNTGTYVKPSSGIPKTDLASSVKTSLGKADTAMQPGDLADWAKASAKPSYTASEIGLGNVDNVRQYSASNPPPYPVTSVNGQTGDVTVESGGTESTTQTITLFTSGWTKSGDRYYQQRSVSGVTASTPVVLVDVALTGTDLDADAAALEAWQLVSANNVTQGNGTLTFYAYDKPTVNIPVNVGVC